MMGNWCLMCRVCFVALVVIKVGFSEGDRANPLKITTLSMPFDQLLLYIQTPHRVAWTFDLLLLYILIPHRVAWTFDLLLLCIQTPHRVAMTFITVDCLALMFE
ncbi:hypothetical protein DPEC_G00101320 [Dallia pectoralis]|uniref:Uncharacterized protein n=1 Tax=Dallia pectoralis TaxID=75939 RepID=A0ACC2GXC0_DALPE|nr:hypothetical protein DPEC_G00101320 [Dallia pectoralis]